MDEKNSEGQAIKIENMVCSRGLHRVSKQSQIFVLVFGKNQVSNISSLFVSAGMSMTWIRKIFQVLDFSHYPYTRISPISEIFQIPEFSNYPLTHIYSHPNLPFTRNI